MKRKAIYLATIALAFSTTVAAEGWKFGIGTGIALLEVDGDSDFFLYDADETKLGGSFLYVF